MAANEATLAAQRKVDTVQSTDDDEETATNRAFQKIQLMCIT